MSKDADMPNSFVFGEGIDWASPLVDTHLFVELPFFLMTEPGTVTITWSTVSLAVDVCSPWMEVFGKLVTDSRATCMYQGHWEAEPPKAITSAAHPDQLPLMQRRSKTVLRLRTRAHSGSFREIAEDEPSRLYAEQQSYYASLCEAHIPIINELIQRYRLNTYDYFAYEVSAWDVPVWYVKPSGLAGRRALLMPYKGWDQKPTTNFEDESGSVVPHVPLWTTLADLSSATSNDATPGELDLIDARSLMERGDYTGAIRRSVTAVEAVLEWALRIELEKRYDPAVTASELKKYKNNFPKRRDQWIALAQPDFSPALFDTFEESRDIRNDIVHRARRVSYIDRGVAQKVVDTGRWLYNHIESKPERKKFRDESDKHGPKSMGRVTLAMRFPAVLSIDHIELRSLLLPGKIERQSA